MRKPSLRSLLLLAVLASGVAPASADAPPISVVPTHVRFGRQVFESNTLAAFTITNRSAQGLVVTIDQIEVGDDFSAGQIESTCTLGDTWLPGGASCSHLVGFRPSEFFAGRESALLRVTARDEAGAILFEREVRLSGTGIAN